MGDKTGFLRLDTNWYIMYISLKRVQNARKKYCTKGLYILKFLSIVDRIIMQAK